MSLKLFTDMTPAPDSNGGRLANAIVGSLVMTFSAVLIGTR